MIKAVIFDFDGVLGDTAKINFELMKRVYPEVTAKEFDEFHRGNVFGNKRYTWKELDFDFYAEQDKLFTPDHLFPVSDAVRELSKSLKLFIISSSSEKYLKKYLDYEGLSDKFTRIMGAGTEKSKVKKFRMIFEEYGLEKDECVFVTDTLGDIKDADEIGVKTLAVAWGYHSIKVLNQGNPLRIVHRFDELVDSIKNIQ